MIPDLVEASGPGGDLVWKKKILMRHNPRTEEKTSLGLPEEKV